MNNLGIAISFVVGGLLLLALLTLNAGIGHNAGETVLDMSAKKKVDTITRIMQRDFVRIGYNLPEGAKKIVLAKPNKFSFRADVDEDADTKATEITWEFTNNKVTATDNPGDYKLIRTGPDGQQSVFAVTYKAINPMNAHFHYFDENGKETAATDNIRTIEVTLQTQSAEKYGDGQYPKALLNKCFTPPSLKLQDVDWKN